MLSRLLAAVFSFCLASLVVFFHSMVSAQDVDRSPQDPVRLRAELIELRAVVTDRQGKLVENLTKDDFEILEEGARQDISFFSLHRLGGPIRRSPIRSEEEAPTGPTLTTPGRTIVLFVDTIHTPFDSLARIKTELRRFVDEQMTPDDLVSLVTTDASLGVLSQFTRDRRLLHIAISRVGPRPPGRRSLFTPYLAALVIQGDPTAMNYGGQVVHREDNVSLDDVFLEEIVRGRARDVLFETSAMRKSTLGTLKAVAEIMSEMPGQKLLMLYSDGFSMFDVAGSMDAFEIRGVVGRAVRSGVVIYSASSRGLEVDPMFDATMHSIPQLPGFSGLATGARRDLENGINALAADSGGRAFFNSNDLSIPISKALEENRAYYSIAYYSTAEKGKFRRVIVNVKGHPDYEVRTQRGYILEETQFEAPARDPREALLKAMAAPLPRTQLKVAASASFYEIGSDNSQISLRVFIDGGEVQYIRDGETYSFDMEVATALFDQRGNQVSTAVDTVKARLRPERVDVARRFGFRHSKRMTVKPGIYLIRVGVREVGSDRIGTATAWVEVPDLNRGRLEMSDLIIAELDGSTGRPVSTLPPPETSLPLGLKSIRQGDALGYHFMLYNVGGRRARESDISMRMLFLAGDRPVYYTAWQPISSRTLGRDGKGIEIGGQFPLVNLDPGLYELRAELKTEGANQPLLRSVLVEITP